MPNEANAEALMASIQRAERIMAQANAEADARAAAIPNITLLLPAQEAGPNDFMADPTLARQQPLSLRLPACVAVVGVGGVGSWIGFFLALAGVPNLKLFDSDTVSESNLNRTPFGPDALRSPTSDLGAPMFKTEALAALIKRMRPQCKVECFPNFTPAFANILGLGHDLEDGWVVCSTDRWSSRKQTYGWCMANVVRYLEAAAEGEYGSITGSPAEFTTADEENPGYASVPVWVGPCVNAASMACAAILHNSPFNSDQICRMGWDSARQRLDFYRTHEATQPQPVAFRADERAFDDEEEVAG